MRIYAIFAGLVVCLAGLCLASDVPVEEQKDGPSASAPAKEKPTEAPPAATAPAASSIVPAAAPKVEVQQQLSPLARGVNLYRHGKFAEATDAFRQAVAEDPKSPVMASWLARGLLKQEMVQQAFEVAQKAVAESADSPAAHTVFGEVLFRQGHIPEAEAQFIQSLKLMGTDARAYLGLSRVYSSISLRKKARIALTKAHELNSNDPEIMRRWLGTLPLKDEIAELEKYLATTTFEDAERREDLNDWLQFLRVRAEQPKRGCRLVSQVASTQTPLQPMMIDPKHLHGWGLNVMVNGKTSTLLLDTGASGLLLSRKAAERAGITYISETRIGGIGDRGDRRGHVGLADSIKIGELEFKDCEVEITDQRRVLGDDGLIGADVFSHYLVDINFPDRVLKLSPLPKRPEDTTSVPATLETEGSDSEEAEKATAKDVTGAESKESAAKVQPRRDSGPQDRYIAPEMKDYTMFFRFGHDMLIPVRLNDGPQKLFLIDTGAFMSLISPETAREVTKVRHDANMRVEGLSGEVQKVFSADKVVLQFGHLKQENRDITSFDLSRISMSTGVEISGALGYSLLGMLDMKIDYRDGLVDFAFDAKRWH